MDKRAHMQKIILWLITLAAAALISYYGILTGGKYFSDFAGYYTASKILVNYGSSADLYNDEYFISKMNSFGIPDTTFIMYVNPPPSAFVMVPLVRMDPMNAKTVWNFINLLLIIIILFLLLKLYKIPVTSSKTPLLIVLTVCTLPYLRNLQRGQVYILLLLFVILFFTGFNQTNILLSSISLAALFLLKFFGWMFFILFIVEKRWKELGLSVLLILIGMSVTVLFTGPEVYKENLEVIINAAGRKDFSFTGLPCIPAFFGALFNYHPQWNTSPLFNVTWLPSVLSAILLLLMLVFSYLRTEAGSMLRLNSILILSVIFTPLAADHHYILFALPAVYLAFKNGLFKNIYVNILVVILILFFLFGWFPEMKINDLKSWEKIIAFPRLYAAVLIWFLIPMKRVISILP